MPTDLPPVRWWSKDEVASIRDRIKRQRHDPPTEPIDVEAIRRRVFHILFRAKPDATGPSTARR